MPQIYTQSRTMVTLSEASYYTRQIVKIVIALAIGYVVVRFSFVMGKKAWLALNPPPPPLPTVKFGALPKIKYPERADLPALEFSLETVEGTLPVLPDRAKVFLIPKKSVTFSTLDQAKKKARTMGFLQDPEKINEFTYKWDNRSAIPTTLLMDISTNIFFYRYRFEEDPNILNEKLLPREEDMKKEAKGFLQNVGLLEEDIEEGEVKIDYYDYRAPHLYKVSSRSEADFAKVRLFRRKIDELPVMPAHPDQGNIFFLFSGNRSDKRLLEIQYTYLPIEEEIFSTYPLRDSTEAWSELRQGAGYIASLGGNESGKVKIRKVYLGYFDPEDYEQYLQPVVVFEGDNGFLGYASAVTEEWLKD